MGKIIKDGIQYAGSVSTAKRIKYDNTKSELESATVQNAIDELSNTVSELEKKNNSATESIEQLIDDVSVSEDSTWSSTKIQKTIENITISGGEGSGSAITTAYDNSTSGLNAESVQGAIDELDTMLDTHTHSASDVGAMPVYTTLEQLGLSSDTNTTTICEAMSSYSRLVLEANNTMVTDLPTGYANIEIVRLSNSRSMARCEATGTLTPKTWFGCWHISSGWSGWQRVYDEGNKPTAADVGAMPIVIAESADWDMDAMLSKSSDYTCYKVGSSTLGTPYKKGATDFAWGWVFNYVSSANYGSQIAFIAGTQHPWMRRKSNGVIGDWTTGYLPSYGGTMTGNLTINKTSGDSACTFIRAEDNSQGFLIKMLNAMQLTVRNVHSSNVNERRLYLYDNNIALANAVRFYDVVDSKGTMYNIYGTHNITCGTSNPDTALATGCIYQKYE